MVCKHLLKMLKSNTEGAISFNYEEINLSPGEDMDNEGNVWDSEEDSTKKTSGLNYAEHFYRISTTIPVFSIQATDDIFSPPHGLHPFMETMAI